MDNKKTIRLGWSAEIGPGAGWGVESQSWARPDLYIEVMQILERSAVEFVVLKEKVRPTLNPVVMAGAVSAGTSTIGIVPELVTTDYPPFKLARLIATLTHVTEGRIGWAMNTSLVPGAHNYGMDTLPPEALRDEIAAEYVDLCRKLWRSWEPDALVEDADQGIFADPSKVQPLHYKGKYFRSRGPLNTTLAPFGDPLLVQFVEGNDCLSFAAGHADVVVVSVSAPKDAAAACTQLRRLAAKAGRNPAALKVYFAVTLQVGQTAGGRAAWPQPTDGCLNLAGSVEEVADLLEQSFDTAGCDGIVIKGNWVTVQVNAICNQVLATLRRRGRLVEPASQGSLRQRIVGH